MIRKIFNLTYLNNFKHQKIKNKTILCLESDYFNVFRFKVENILNEEDRKIKIEDRLEILFPKYEYSKYILEFEIVEKTNEDEILLVYLLDIEKIKEKNKNIIDDITKFKIISIIPNFLKVREYKGKDSFYNFDLGNNTLIVSRYKNSIIEDIQLFQIDFSESSDTNNSSYFNIINSFLTYIDSNTPILFTGKEINFDNLILDNKNFLRFDVDKINIKNYPNFLPQNIKKKYFLYYTNEKYLLSLFLLTIISSILLIFLYTNINKLENKLASIHSQKFSFENDIENLKKENAELEKFKLEIVKEIDEIENSKFEIHKLLEEIFKNVPKNLKLISIEYDEQKVFNIIGESIEITAINSFLKNLQNSKNLYLKNSDYILKKENTYEFRFEIKYK